MCTVSIIGFTQPASRGRAVPCGFRLITNRDELRTRPLATPPRWHDPDMRVVGAGDAEACAIFPVDPVGGGTWVGAAPNGLVLCLLNANPMPPPALPPRDTLISRGMVIPRLLAGLSQDESAGGGENGALDRVMDALGGFDLARFAPFRLVGVELAPGSEGASFRIREAKWDLSSLAHEFHDQGAACFVSSALGDPLVKPRLSLFEAMVQGPFDAPGPAQSLSQDRFHRHVWPGRAEISVLMSRPDARTVSITSVEVGATPGAARPSVAMWYEAVHEPQVVTKQAAPALALRRSPV